MRATMHITVKESCPEQQPIYFRSKHRNNSILGRCNKNQLFVGIHGGYGETGKYRRSKIGVIRIRLRLFVCLRPR